MGRFIDLTGKKFNRLTVIEEAGRSKYLTVLWLCKCDCGNEKVIASKSLISNHTKSCGCLQKEIMSNRIGNYNPNYGKQHSDKTKHKMSIARSGSNNYFYGKHLSEEHKRKLSISKKGSNSYRWNPNREEINTNRKIYRFILNSIHRILTNKKDKHSVELLGYTKEQLKMYLERKFQEGMTWDNYGNKEGQWSIDHITPVSYYTKEGITDPMIINRLDNLQPLWAKDNLRKNNKLDYKEVA